MTNKPKKVMSPSDIITVHALLKDVLEPIRDGYVKYKASWDDIKVAEVAGGGINEHHVARLRSKLFGPLFFPTFGTKMNRDQICEAVRQLETRLAVLERKMNILVGEDSE